MRLPSVEGAHRFSDERKSVTVLPGTCGQDGPDAFAPALSVVASRSLGDEPMDDAVADIALGQAVHRFHLGVFGEEEVVLSVLLQPLDHVGFPRCLAAAPRGEESVLHMGHASVVQFRDLLVLFGNQLLEFENPRVLSGHNLLQFRESLQDFFVSEIATGIHHTTIIDAVGASTLAGYKKAA